MGMKGNDGGNNIQGKGNNGDKGNDGGEGHNDRGQCLRQGQGRQQRLRDSRTSRQRTTENLQKLRVYVNKVI